MIDLRELRELGKHDRRLAITKLNEAIERAHADEDPRVLADAHLALADLHFLNGTDEDFERAKEHSQRALSRLQGIAAPLLEARARIRAASAEENPPPAADLQVPCNIVTASASWEDVVTAQAMIFGHYEAARDLPQARQAALALVGACELQRNLALGHSTRVKLASLESVHGNFTCAAQLLEQAAKRALRARFGGYEHRAAKALEAAGDAWIQALEYTRAAAAYEQAIKVEDLTAQDSRTDAHAHSLMRKRADAIASPRPIGNQQSAPAPETCTAEDPLDGAVRAARDAKWSTVSLCAAKALGSAFGKQSLEETRACSVLAIGAAELSDDDELAAARMLELTLAELAFGSDHALHGIETAILRLQIAGQARGILVARMYEIVGDLLLGRGEHAAARDAYQAAAQAVRASASSDLPFELRVLAKLAQLRT